MLRAEAHVLPVLQPEPWPTIRAGLSGVLTLVRVLSKSAAPANAQLRAVNPRLSTSLGGGACSLAVQTLARFNEECPAGGVSSFGFSGTIVHALLRQGGGPDARQPCALPLARHHAPRRASRELSHRAHEQLDGQGGAADDQGRRGLHRSA